jgi:uncharacterized membrane protein YgcG
MNLPSAPIEASVSTDRQSKGDIRLHEPWLILARMLWLAIFVLTRVVCCANLLVGSYGLVTTILLVANTSVWFAVSLVLFWRKFTDRAILLISLQLVITTGFFIPHYPGALVNYGVWWVPIDILALLAGIALIFAYTFPDGRFVPGFTRWLAFGWIAISLLPIPLLGAFYPWNWWLSRSIPWCEVLFIAVSLSPCCTAIGGCPRRSNVSRSSGWSSPRPSSSER